MRHSTERIRATHGGNLPRPAAFDALLPQGPVVTAEVAGQLPGAVQWDLVSVSFSYVASGNAATRIPFVSFFDQSATTFCKINTAVSITASHTVQVTFAQEIGAFGAANAASMGNTLPDIRLLDGLQVQVSADAIDVADTITAVRLYVRQYDVRPDYS